MTEKEQDLIQALLHSPGFMEDYEEALKTASLLIAGKLGWQDINSDVRKEIELEIVIELNEVFAPQKANERFTFLLEGCNINDAGKPQPNSWFNQFPKKHAIPFFLHLIGACPVHVDIDESLRVRNITKLNIEALGLTYIPSLYEMTSLTKLECYENQLTSLDLSGCSSLTKLKCYENQLTSLDLSQNIALTHLDCKNNKLTKLDITQNRELSKLNCSNNKLSSSDQTEIMILNNKVTDLDPSMLL